MPHPNSVPTYCLHKPTGQARVIINGRHVYLGPYGSPGSRAAYARLISEHCRAGCGDRPPPAEPAGRYPAISINELLLRYLEHAGQYYVKDGKPTSEVKNMKDAMKAPRTLYGLFPAQDFGPLALKAVRQFMINEGNLCRNVINARVNRIRRIFRWAASEELVPPSVYEGLRAVEGLRKGRCDAHEAEPVGPVADIWVEATLPFLSPQVADMVRLQRLTSMRPGNIVSLRWADIDQTADVWLYRPASHKTDHLGKTLTIPLGPKAQTILRGYELRPAHAPIFSPCCAEDQRHEQRRAQHDRTTPVFPCELRRLAAERKARLKRKRKRPPGKSYTTSSYARSITYAIAKAKRAGAEIVHWHPNQLRHSRATEVRRQFGLEGAQVVLGHAHASITEVYAERDLEKAVEIARMTG